MGSKTIPPWEVTSELGRPKAQRLAGPGGQGFSNLSAVQTNHLGNLGKMQIRIHRSGLEPKIPYFLSAPPQGSLQSRFAWHGGAPRAQTFSLKVEMSWANLDELVT